MSTKLGFGDILAAVGTLRRSSENYNVQLGEFSLAAARHDPVAMDEIRDRLHDALDCILDAVASSTAVCDLADPKRL